MEQISRTSREALSNAVQPFDRDESLPRSHPRHAIPFRLVVAGRSYEGEKISVVEIIVAGDAESLQGRSVHPGQLIFPLDGFELLLEAEVRVLAVQDGRIGLTFVSPFGPHRATLDSIINGIIAGDLVTVDRVLSARNRIAAPSTAAAGHPRGFGSALGRFVRGAAALALGLGLAAFVGHQIYGRLFTTQPAAASFVASTSVVVNAPVSGQLVSVDSDAAQGNPVFSVLSTAGRLVSVDMPCDCRVISQSTELGSSVRADERIVVVVSKTAQAHVVAQVQPSMLNALYGGRKAQVTLPDGRYFTAEPFDLPKIAAPASSDELVAVKLRPSEPLADQDVGLPADVTFTDIPELSLAALRDEVRQLVGSAKARTQ